MSIQSNNKLLKAVPSDKFRLLEGFIDNIKSRYHVNLNIHDIAGLSAIDPALEKILGPYLYHNNSFCNYVKKKGKNFEMCSKSKDLLCKKCKELDGPFYGKCYMGVEEFVFPVKWEDNLIAVICVGQFFDEAEATRTLVGEKAKTYLLDKGECIERYFDVASKITFTVKEMCFDMGILCQQLLSLYMDYITRGKISPSNRNNAIKIADDHKSTHIISNTIKFIKENYNRKLSLSLLAANSFCNSSYLSYIFKEKTGSNISDYVNQIRIEVAKQILDTTTKTITETCFIAGYNDSNYFSRVFKQSTGMSPKEYRNRET